MSVGKVVLCSCVNLGYIKLSFLCDLCGSIDEIGWIVAAKSYLQFMSFLTSGFAGVRVKVRKVYKNG